MRDSLARATSRRRAARAFVALSLILSALAGCSIDYRSAEIAQKLPESVPDTVLTDFTSTTMRGQLPYFRIQAQSAETFGKKNETVLTDVQFQEFDKNGSVIAEGRAHHAVYYTDTQNAELSGDLNMYSLSEHARFSADSLAWNNDAKTLTGKPDALVVIKKDSGSFLEGRGFQADTRTRSFQFSGGVEGTWVGESNR